MAPPGRLVTIKRSGEDGACFPLSLSSCSFGRDIECDIRIQLPVVSKLHCRIEVREQEATLYNFSSTNPTQLNGSVIEKPVLLEHGDVITIIDRSFRYEKEDSQNESKPDEFPGKGQEQAPLRRSSRSSLSAPPDGKTQDSGAHPKVSASRSQEPVKELREDGATSDGSEHRAAPDPPRLCSPEQVGNNGKKAGQLTSGGLKENSRATASPSGDLKSSLSSQSLDSSKKTESPFEKLYQSMKEELSLSSKKQRVAQNQRKSGLQLDCATEKERRETQSQMSHKARPRSGDSVYIKAASPFTPETDQSQEKGIRGDSTCASNQPLSSSIPLADTTKTPGPQQRKDKGPCIIGRESVNVGTSEGIRSAGRIVTPRKRLTGNHTSAIAECAVSPPVKSDSLSLRSRSIPTDEERLPSEVRKEPFVTQCPSHAENKIPKDFLDEPSKLAVKSGQIGSGLPGLSSVDISNFGDFINKSEGASLKRRRVSFGGRLKPELFDENLPPNTPLKRGETPGKRKCPVTHGPTVLKKIVKEQPGSEKEEDSSSEICLEVTAQNVCAGAPASSPGVTQPGVNGQRRRSGKASAASGGSESLEQTDAPKKAGRKSSGLSSKRASISRGQHDILQMICSKRRSGASEANLMVAKSWAEIVKLGVKQTQMKVVKHSPPKPVSRRQRRQSTPKKPTASIHQQFSTGHANSPCTIIIGKAQTKRVSIPARPSRMLNSFVFNRKMDYSEDLSGITELFKTPAKEKPQTAGPSSLPGKQFQEVNSGEQPLNSTASEIWEENMFFSPQNSVQKPSDKHSESHTLNQQSLQDRSTGKTPQDVFKVTHLERTTPDAVEEPLNTVPSANKSRRSRELRSALTPPVKMKNERLEAAQADGKPLRKTPLRGQKGEGEDRKGLAETCKQSDKSKENSTKTTAVSRSRSEGQKLRPTKELLGTPTHTKEPDNEVDQTTETPYRASQGSDCSNTRKRQSKTPLRTADDKGDVPYVSDPTVRAHKTPDSGTARATGNPKHSRDPAISASGVKKGTRTPKKESQPLEDLAGFKELFQTANEPVTDDKTKPCQSPRPLPTSTKSQLISPTRKMDAKGLSALRKSVHLSGGNAYNPKVTQPDFTSIRALKETTEQLLHPSGNRTGSKRQWKSPGERTQLEDLAGFQELSQTPGHAKDTVTTDGPTQVTDETPRAATTRAPRSIQRKPRTSLENVCVQEVSLLTKQRQSPGQALKTSTVPTVPEQEGPIVPSVQTPEQKPGMTGHLTGSKRRSRASKGRSQLLGDLSGLQELFQTPDHSNHPMIVMKTAEIPSKPPQSEPVKAPTGVKRQTRTSLGNIGGGEFSPIMKQRPSLGKSLQTPTVPEQERPITALMQTPEQKPGMTGHLTSSKSRPRTSKGRSQLLGDLSGLQELFQTPDHGKDPRTPGEPAEIPSQSPEPGSAKIPGRTLRRSKTSLGKALVEGLLPGLGELSQASLHEPEGEDSGIQAQKPLSKRKLSSEASVTVSKRVRRSPREKAQPLEDLSCLQQLFQTPGHARDTAATDEITKMTSPSPKPGAVKTPGSTEKQPRASLGHLAVKEELSSLRKQRQVSVGTPTMLQPGGAISALGLTPEQKPHLTTAVFTGPNRRTPGRRSQALRDLPGLQELSQTPEHGRDRMTANRTTEVSGKWPQPEPVGTLIQTPDHNNHPMILMETTEMPSKLPRSEPVKAPTGVKRQTRTSLGNIGGRELSPLMKKGQSPGKAFQTPIVPEQEGPIVPFVQTPEQKPGMTGHLTGSKRRSRASKGRSQLLGDLSGLQELFQTPDHSNHPMIVMQTTEIPSKPPQSEPVKAPTGVKRQTRTSLGNIGGGKFSPIMKQRPSLGKSLQTPTVPEQERPITALMQTPEQKPELAEDFTGSKRKPQTSKGKSQLLGDLSGLQELFQTPDHSNHPMIVMQTTEMPSKLPQSEPVKAPTGVKRQTRTSLGNIGGGEFSPIMKQRPSLGKSLQTPTVPEQERPITALMQTPEQKPELAEDFTGSKRKPQTSKGKSQLLGDLSGLQELFQTPDHSNHPMIVMQTTEMPSKLPQSEPVKAPTGVKRQTRTSLGNIGGGEFSPIMKQRPSLGKSLQTPTVPEQERPITALMQTPEQKPELAEDFTGSKRKPQTSKGKSQLLGDLSGLQKLFQTPDHSNHPMIVMQTTEMPSKLPQSEPVKAPTGVKRQTRTSLGNIGGGEFSPIMKQRPSLGKSLQTPTVPEQERPITALMQTPEQKPGMTGHLTSSKSRPRTSKGRSQLLGDLSGLQELFQTPDHGKDPRTPGEPAEIPSQSPEPGSAKIPGRTLRRSKTSLEKALVEGLLPGLGELSQASLHEPEGEDSGIQAQKPLSKRKLSSEASVTVSKRVRRSPREKAQPLEDLSCLQQLFQTPGHARDTAATDEITKMTSPSPKPGAVKTPGSTEKQPRASLGHLAVKEELSSLRKQRQVSVGTPTMLQPGDAISALGLTPEQKPHLTTAVFTGPNRRTPGRRSQALRDLPGLQELSQTPEHGRDRMTANRTTEVSGKWPQPEPVGTPMGMRRQRGTGLGNVDVKEELRKQRSPSGAAERSPATTQGEAALEESADQTLHTVAHTRGRWGKPRAPKERSQPLEDLDGLQELFRTPGHTKDMVPLDITGLPCASPQSEPVDTQTTPGCQSRSSVGKLRVKEELPATRELREVLGGTAHTHRVPDAGVTVPKTGAEAARPAHDLVRIAGGRLRRVLSREQAPPLEDLSGLPELFQTPGHTEEVGPCTAPQPEPTNIPTTSKRQTRASLGRASADGELLGLAKFPQESGETTHMPQVPGGEDRVRVVRARTKRKLDPAESVAGSKSKRLRGAPEEKAQPLDHLAGLQELSQTPGQTEDTTPEGTTKMSPQSPRPRALDIPAPSERTARTRMQTVEKKELPQDTSAPPERTARTRLRIADNKEGLPQDTSAPPERATRTRMRTVEKEEELPQDTSAPPERATRTRLRIADKKEELPGAKTLTRASRQTTRARKVLEGDVTDVQTSEESAKQTLDPGKSVSGTRRQRGSRKESPRALDGQAAPEEIIQTPAHMEDSGSDGNASKIACQSPQPEPDTDRTWRGQLRTRRGKAVVSKETLVPGKMPGPSQETSETPGEPVPGGKCVAMLKEPSEPGLAPAARVTRPKRLQGAAAEKAQALETLARPPEVLQEPCHMEDSAGDRKSTKMSCQPLQPQAQDTSAPPERAARTRMRTVEKEEELPQDTSAPPERTARTRLRIADKKEELPQDTSAPPERTARTRMRTVEKKEGLPQDTSAPPERATRTRLRTVGKEEELPQDTSAPPERAARRRLQTVEKKELPQDTSAPPERTARTRLQTVEKKEELPGARTLTRASRQTTRARKVPEGDVTDIQTSEESAKQTLDPGKSVSGTRRQRGSRKESPRALDGQAAPEEIIQTPAHTEELTNSAIIPKPLKTSPRVLRAPKEKPASSVILKRGPEEDVPPVQGSVSPPPASAEKPAVEQGPARSRRPRPPTSLKKVLTPEVHLGEEQSSNSINTEDGDPKEAPTAANQKMSLCTRHQKNRSVEQQGPERLGSAEKVQVKRNAKKSEKTSQDTEPQNQEDGGQQPASRGQARGGRGGLRSGGQNKAPLPLPAEESMESPSRGQKATAGRSVVRGLRAKRTATQSAGSVLDSEAEPRVTRGAKRDAENPVKANDTVNTKRMRTKRQQAGEELQRRR